MKKIFNYLYILIIVSIVNILNCNAECSYQERKDLLNKAKNVDIYYEVEEKERVESGVNSFGEKVDISLTDYIFKFNITNLDNDIYISYKDYENNEQFITSNNLNDGIYTFEVTNYNSLYTYEFEIHTYSKNCLGEKIYTNRIIKPIYNGFSNYAICQEENMEGFKYCKKFLTENIRYTESELLDKANEYLKSFETDDNSDKFNILDFFFKYYMYFILVFVIIVGCVVFIIIRKKRSEL